MSHDRIPGEVDPRDVLDLDSLLDDDERLGRDTVRRFVADKVLPEVGEWFDEGRFPAEMAKEFGALGVLGMHLEGYGCAGTSATQYGLACLELEAGDSGARSFVSVQGSSPCSRSGRSAPRSRSSSGCRGMAAGELIGCFGLTEPDSGSDPASMRTTARQRRPRATGCSTAPRCGSPTAALRTWPWCGPAPTRTVPTAARSAASWCPPTPPASRRR